MNASSILIFVLNSFCEFHQAKFIIISLGIVIIISIITTIMQQYAHERVRRWKSIPKIVSYKLGQHHSIRNSSTSTQNSQYPFSKFELNSLYSLSIRRDIETIFGDIIRYTSHFFSVTSFVDDEIIFFFVDSECEVACCNATICVLMRKMREKATKIVSYHIYMHTIDNVCLVIQAFCALRIYREHLQCCKCNFYLLHISNIHIYYILYTYALYILFFPFHFPFTL